MYSLMINPAPLAIFDGFESSRTLWVVACSLDLRSNVKILGDIVELAASDDARLVTILRKCLIVAAQLKNDRLREWALAELTGYKDHLAMPDYRVCGITAKGHFLGALGAQLINQPLASGVLRDEDRWWATTCYLKESISSYESSTSSAKSTGSFIMHWPADLVFRYQNKFYDGYVLNRAWQELYTGAIVAVVDAVRTRILQLALELHDQSGSDENSIPSADALENKVQTIIYGGMNIFGPISGNAQMINHYNVVQGNIDSLAKALKKIGFVDDSVSELLKTIEADGAEDATGLIGSGVLSWIKKAGTYLGKEGAKAGIEVAQKAATQAIFHYFGLPTS